MDTSYFLTYGLKEVDTDSVKKDLEEGLNISFDERFSDYVGSYFHYSGDIADRISIQLNYIDFLKDFKEESFKDYQTLIYFSFVNGKPQEKIRKVELIKISLSRDFPNLSLLKEKVIPNI